MDLILTDRFTFGLMDVSVTDYFLLQPANGDRPRNPRKSPHVVSKLLSINTPKIFLVNVS